MDLGLNTIAYQLETVKADGVLDLDMGMALLVRGTSGFIKVSDLQFFLRLEGKLCSVTRKSEKVQLVIIQRRETLSGTRMRLGGR